MALNFPANPENGDTYTEGGTTWQYNGVVWNIVEDIKNIFSTVNADTGTATAVGETDSFTIAGGTDISTSITDKTITINFDGTSGSTQNLFSTIQSDDGSTTASSPTEILDVIGGTNISTRIGTDTVDLEINMDPFEIGFLSNVSNASATTGQVLKWDGAQWAPGADVSSGGGGDTTSVIAPVAFGRVADITDSSGTNISWQNWLSGPGTFDFTFSTAQPDTNYIVVSDAETFDDYYVGISSKTVNGFTATFYDSAGVRAPSSASPFSIIVYGSTPTVDVSVGANADTLDGFEGTYYLDYNNFTNTPSVLTLTSLSIGNELAATGDGAISYDNTTGVFRYTPPDLSSYITSVAFSDLTSTPTTIAGYGITDSPEVLTDLGISDGTNGQVLTTDGAGNFSFTTVSSGGSGATTFLQLTDTPSSFGTAGQVATVNSTADGLEFTTVSAGEANQNAFSNIAVSGQTTVTADTSTDTLTLAGGTNISITTNDNTVTINSNTNFSDLTDSNTATLSIDKIYEPAIAMLRVDNTGTTAYTFPSHYTGTNPTIYVLAGTTIAFDLDNIPGHPFEIQDGTGSPYDTGLVHVASDGTVSTGSNAQGKSSGTLYWRIQEGISGGYRYQCQSHAAMVGAITVKRLSVI